jgi:signal transduction histidine kinase
VVDHGPGIATDSAPHVFERFWRADSGRVRAQGGTGLGLSIVAAIADAHGGRVLLTETPGGGATFSVEVPVEPGHEPETWGAKGQETFAGNGSSLGHPPVGGDSTPAELP